MHDFLDEMYAKDPETANEKMRGVSWWPEWKREWKQKRRIKRAIDRIIATAVKEDKWALDRLAELHEDTKNHVRADDNIMVMFQKAKAAAEAKNENDKCSK